MALAVKALVALNDAATLALDEDFGSYVGVEYGPVGADGVTASTGTVVVEGSISGVQWVACKINDAASGSVVNSYAAVGVGYVDARAFTQIRARMSVVGGAQGVKVYLNRQKVG